MLSLGFHAFSIRAARSALVRADAARGGSSIGIAGAGASRIENLPWLPKMIMNMQKGSLLRTSAAYAAK